MTRIDSDRAADPSIDPLGLSLSDALASGDGSESYGLMIWLTRLRQERVMGGANAVDLNLETTRRIGHFELESLLGSGAYGAVFRALDTRLGRRVALKVAWPGILMDPVLSKRFIKEPKTVALLSHPGIVEVYETGNLELAWFMVLELIDGPTLEQWLAKQQRVPPPVAASMMRDVALAVDYAHSHGVVHRDLKPSNVLLRPSVGADEPALAPVVTDFGLAHWPANGEASALTATCVVLGTDHYMSPEQAAGQNSEVGPASDVFSLGVILYEMISGRRPFDGKTSEEVRCQIREREPKSLRRRVNDVPRDLETILLKCLEKLPGNRYPSAQELADDLGRFLRNEPIKARRPSLSRRALKYVQRNPLHVSFAMSTAVGSLMVIGIIAAWSSDRLSTGNQLVAAKAAESVAEGLQRQQRYVANIQKASETLQLGRRSVALSLLEESRSVGREPTHRGLEWDYLYSEAQKTERSWAAHVGNVHCVRFSPDGKYLGSAGKDGRVVVWDFETNAQQWEFDDHVREVNVVAFSADGLLLAVGGDDGRVVIHQVSDGAIVFDEPVNSGAIFDMLWLGKKPELAVGGDGGVLTILDPLNRQQRNLQLLPTSASQNGKTFRNQIRSLAYIPDRNAVAVVTKLTDIQVVDVSSLTVIRSWNAKRISSGTICFIPEGPGYLATSAGDNFLQIWNIDSQAEVCRVDTRRILVDLKYSASCKRLFGASDAIEMWDSEAVLKGVHSTEKRLTSCRSIATTIDVSPDGAWVVWGDPDGGITVQRSTGETFDAALRSKPLNSKLSSCGRWISVLERTANDAWGVEVIEASSGQYLWSVQASLAPELMGEYRMFTPAEAIAFNPSGDTLASFDADFILRTRNARDGHVVRGFTLATDDLPIQITYFSPDGRFLVAQKHRSNGIVFDVNSGEVVTRFNERSRWRLGIFRTIRGEGWIDVDRGLELDHEPFSSAPALFTVTGPPRVIRSPVVSHDGRWLAAGCDDRAIYVWDLEQDGPPTKLVGHESQIKSLAFSNDGGTLVSQNFDDTVRFWDVATGAEVLRLGTADERIHSMALSTDSRLLALGVERDGRFGLRLHRLSTGTGSAVDGEAATVANPSK